MSKDLTFSDDSMYGSILWAAVSMGMTKDRFFRQRDRLYQEGFPRPDPLTKKYLKADVRAWIARRRQIDDLNDAPKQKNEVNHDAL